MGMSGNRGPGFPSRSGARPLRRQIICLSSAGNRRQGGSCRREAAIPTGRVTGHAAVSPAWRGEVLGRPWLAEEDETLVQDAPERLEAHEIDARGDPRARSEAV
jgi:hypothetical protein